METDDTNDKGTLEDGGSQGEGVAVSESELYTSRSDRCGTTNNNPKSPHDIGQHEYAGHFSPNHVGVLGLLSQSHVVSASPFIAPYTKGA